MPSLESIRYSSGELSIINQLKLPLVTEYMKIQTLEDGWNAIKTMQVRGAPAIMVVGCLTLAVDLRGRQIASAEELGRVAQEGMRYLLSARPTAVNLQDAALKLDARLRQAAADRLPADEAKQSLVAWLESQLEADAAMNRRLSELGAEHLLERCRRPMAALLTICNTGALATAGHGTALGLARSLHARDKLRRLFCLETRPYNQGARLTAYEAVHEAMPATLLADSAAAALLSTGDVDAVVVGADRIVSNGDFANKIGTYQLAIAAHHHAVPFYVVAPSTTFDFRLRAGAEIVIEQRPEQELTHVGGSRIAAPGIEVWNPAFDVTPAELVTGGVVCEFGVFTPAELESKLKPQLSSS